MTDGSEQALLERARAGDGAAFADLQKLLQRPAQRFLRRLIGAHSAEEDILREASLALYLNLERLTSADALRPFLFRVIRNLCYSELRKQGRFTTISLDDPCASGDPAVRNLAEPRPPPHDQVEWLLLYAEVQQALGRLPELQRQALILYFEEDLTYPQIAEIMGADVGTIKSRIYYSRQNLLKHLKPDVAEAFGLVKKERRDGNSR